jgi:hypothetical protein
MKFCPVCRRRYEDEQNFCLDDGTSLANFSSESEVPTAHYDNLSDIAVNPTEASPTVFVQDQTPSPTYLPPEQTAPPNFFPQARSTDSAPPKKSNALGIVLMSIFGTLFAVGIIGGGIWLLSGNRQTSNRLSSNSSLNSNQNSSTIAKANAPAVSNQIENSKSNKKSSNNDAKNANNPDAAVLSNRKTESNSANTSKTPLEDSTVDLQVKHTTSGKTQSSPVSGASVTIQTQGKTLSAITNNAGIAYFKDISCGGQVRITVKDEDGTGTFTRSLKCGANAAWGYQTDCFATGKNGGCAIEQIK